MACSQSTIASSRARPSAAVSPGPTSLVSAYARPACGKSGSTLRSVRSRAVSYVKKNLREVEDQAVKHGLSETQEARFARRDLSAEQTGLNFLTVKPGRREAFAHRHRTAEEVYVVLGGSGHVKLDDELVELQPLDAVCVAPGTTRSFEAGDDGLQVLIFGPHVEGDGEMVEDFWAG